MARTYNLANGGLRFVLSRKEAEAVARGERSYVLAATGTTAPATPVADSRFECTETDCYKFGHLFSRVGAYGRFDANGAQTDKGHFDLNPTHVAHEVPAAG